MKTLKDLNVRDVFTVGTNGCEFIKIADLDDLRTKVFNLTSLSEGYLRPRAEVVYLGQLSLTKDTK